MLLSPGTGSFLTQSDQNSAEYTGGPAVDLQSSPSCRSLVAGPLSLEPQLPWAPWTPCSVSSPRGEHRTSPLCSTDCRLPPGIEWGQSQVLSHSFPVSQYHCPSLPDDQCLENHCFMYFHMYFIFYIFYFLIYFLVVSGMRVNQVPLSPS